MRRVPLRRMARDAHGLQPVGLRGTTLTEVLMAILVMGVGILSVMTLFPIAYLRSVQGTQLTNSTILKMRADSVVDMFGLVTDQYIPQPIEGDVTRCLIDPLGWQDAASAGVPNIDEYGVQNNAGMLQTIRYTPSNSPVAVPNPPRRPTEFINVAGPRVFDQFPMPLRRLGFAVQPIQLRVQGGGAVDYSAGLLAPLFPLPPNGRDPALAAVALPDTLQTQLTAVPSSNTATQVAFDTANVVNPDDLTYLEGLFNSGIPLRLTFINVTGKQSQTRTISNALLPAVLPPPAIDVGGGTIGWATNEPLPPSFLNNLSEVRVETFDPRYTWMLTVRKKGISGGSVTEIDCVVFFNRATEDPEEELVHNAAFDPQQLGFGTVFFTTYPSGQTAPLRKGGWVFDPTHAEWYRVQDIISETPGVNALIELDRRPEQQITTLVVPRGVIHVFPMKTRITKGR